MKTVNKALAVLCILTAPTIASAGGIPTIDVSNIVQTTATAKNTLEQVKQLKEAYEAQLDQLREAIRQGDALTGNSGIGNILNGAADRDNRRYAPESWEDTVKILEAGGLPGSADDVRAYYEAVKEQTNVAGAADINTVNPEAPNALAFENRRDTTFAAQSVARASYNQTGRRIDDYERLMAEIENTPDAKAAADLTNRIAAQNGLTMAELIRLQAAQMQQNTTADNQALIDATNNARLSRFKAYPLGEIPSQ